MKKIKPIGAPPATMLHLGERRAETAQLRLTTYDEDHVSSVRVDSIDEIEFSDDDKMHWLEVSALHDVALVVSVCEALGIHPLIGEDVLNTNSAPKFDDVSDGLFTLLKVPVLSETGEEEVHQLSFFLKENLLITFSENGLEFVEPLHKRLKKEGSRIRAKSGDYLAWAVMDLAVDHVLAAMDRTQDRLEVMELAAVENEIIPDLAEIHGARREVAKIHRIARPLRDITNDFCRSKSHLIHDSSAMYFDDLHDHSMQGLEMAEHLRDHAASLRELYFTINSNRMNEVMKVLAGISVIFLPLSFLVGLYGMNFDFMPELHWHWGYPVLLLVMITLVLSMIWVFKKKKWF